MRRVYTAYAMRMLGGTRARHFFVMCLSVVGMVQFVSFMDVAENLSRVTVGEVGSFFMSAVIHTEVWTLVVLTIFVYAAISFIRKPSISPRFA